MDEELEQSNQKINVDSFFQSLQPVNELAQAAMAQSEVTFSLAQQNSQLIQALQSSLIDVQSGVSEITNYIIVQQKQKTKQLDKLADDIVAQQDKQQKGGKSKADQLKDDLPFAEDKKKTGKSNLVKSLGDVANQAVAGANSQLGSLAALGLLGAGSKLFKEKKKYNLGGQVSGSGDADTVPAMLTPGEFVISKDAVNQVGVDALKNINAAAGSTSKPTPYFELSIGREDPNDFTSNVITESFFDTGKGRSSDFYEETTSDGTVLFSHKSDMTGSSISESSYKHTPTFTETDEDGGVETFTETEEMTTKISSIAKDDLIKHQNQLLGEIHKIKGFENVTIDDVLKGSTGLPKDTMFNILSNSDASFATDARTKEQNLMPTDYLVSSSDNFRSETKTRYNSNPTKLNDFSTKLASLSDNINQSVKGYNQGGLVESVSKPQVKSNDFTTINQNDLTPPDDDMGVQILPPISQTVGGSDNQSTSPPFTASSIEAESIGETVSSVNFIDVISNPYLSLA